MARRRDTGEPIGVGSGCVTGLTARQVEILELAAHGLSGRQIGRRLGISARTVEGHFSNMRQRTGARSEAELTAYGVAAGLLMDFGPAPARRNGIPEQATAAWPHSKLSADAGKRSFAGTTGRAVNPQAGSVGNTRRKSTPENPPSGSFRQMLFGYARVSTAEQNPSHQIDALLRAGVPREQIYLDTAGGAKASRPQLEG